MTQIQLDFDLGYMPIWHISDKLLVIIVLKHPKNTTMNDQKDWPIFMASFYFAND